MTDYNVNSYSVKSSKSGHKIPVINDIHLHSTYNPIREAESLIDQNSTLIKSRPNLLILGLGFGYHVNLANKLLASAQYNSYHIMVIEPVKRTFSDCVTLNLLDRKNTSIYAGEKIESLYANNCFTDFLLKAPTVFAHPSSFNLHNQYFKDLLAFEASDDISVTAQNINDQALRNYLLSFPNHQTLDRTMDYIKIEKHPINSEYDHLLLAFKHMITPSTKLESP